MSNPFGAGDGNSLGGDAFAGQRAEYEARKAAEKAAQPPVLSPTNIRAKVRIDGTRQKYVPRVFELMLDHGQPETRQRKEAARILRQIGYEPRAIEFIHTA